MAGIGERLAGADKYPILDCFVSTGVWSQGLGYVGISRELPGGQVAFVWFLLDRYCLGVKDLSMAIEGRFSYDSRLRKLRSHTTLEPVDPASARKLVEGGVAYAEQLGLHPYADYAKASRIFGSIDPSTSTRTFAYGGEDGKPMFIARPYDTPERCRRILAALERSCGPAGYHYLIPLEQAGALPGAARSREPLVIDMEKGEPVGKLVDLDEDDEPDDGDKP